MKIKLVIFLVLAAVLLVACQSGPIPTKEILCSERAAVFLSNIDLLLRESAHRPAFLSDIKGYAQPCGDTSSAAGITSCIELIDVVSEIQRIHQAVEDLVAPDCAANVRIYLTDPLSKRTT